MNNSFPKKILIIRLSSIGDIVLTSAFVRILRNTFPNSQIDFLIFEQYKLILQNNIQIDNVISFEKRLSHSVLENFKNDVLLANNYDVIFDLHNNKKSRFLCDGLLSERYYIDKRRGYKLGLIYLKKGMNKPYKLINDIYLETLSKYNFTDDGLGLEFWLDSDKSEKKYLVHKKNYEKKSKLNIVVAPGATYKTKMWLIEYYIELIELLKPYINSLTVIGGNKDIKLANQIEENHNLVINLCGKSNLIETAEIIDKSDLLICNDSGVMHIAAARQTPVAVFFGSTVKEFGFEPFRVPNIILDTELYCRPCTHIGRRTCPLIHFRCMKDVTPPIAFDNIRKFIKSIYE